MDSAIGIELQLTTMQSTDSLPMSSLMANDKEIPLHTMHPADTVVDAVAKHIKGVLKVCIGTT